MLTEINLYFVRVFLIFVAGMPFLNLMGYIPPPALGISFFLVFLRRQAVFYSVV